MPKKATVRSALWVSRCKTPGLYAVGGVDGLQLQVKESGARSWILRIKVGERRPDIGLGGYPDVTLEEARDKARVMRAQVDQGIDPIAARKAAQDALRAAVVKALTFDQAARLCHRAKAPEFRNGKHANQWISTLATYASPQIGSLPVETIDLPLVIKVLEPIWQTKTETATRLRERIEAVLAWATVNGYREGDNPARWKGNLEHALPKPSKVKRVTHHPALPWHELGAFMVKLRKHKGTGARALEFAILTAARSGEVRFARWEEIDLAAKLWTVPAERMKAGKVHHVPLPDAAIALLKALPRMAGSPYVFAMLRGGAPSDSTLSKVTRTLGVAAVPHGFRSTFKDWARSNTAFADEVSELALAHVSSDATRAAYARDELVPKRRAMMAAWAKYCGTVPSKGNVIALRRKA